MLFSEIHGAYFDAVSSILSAAVDGRLTQQKLLQIVQEKGFTESTLTIPQKLQSGLYCLHEMRQNLSGCPDRKQSFLYSAGRFS